MEQKQPKVGFWTRKKRSADVGTMFFERFEQFGANQKKIIIWPKMAHFGIFGGLDPHFLPEILRFESWRNTDICSARNYGFIKTLKRKKFFSPLGFDH